MCPLLRLLTGQTWRSCGVSCCVPALPLVVALALRLAPFGLSICGVTGVMPVTENPALATDSLGLLDADCYCLVAAESLLLVIPEGF